MTDWNIKRDRWGRPLLHPPEGGKPVPYTRPSTMKGWTDDKSGLIDWTASMALVGMAKSKPLQARMAAIVAKGDDDPYDSNKGALKELVETAKTLAQSQGRADFGTSIHEFTELVDAGTLDWSYVPESLKGPLHAYEEAVAALTVVDTEVFITVDEHVDGLEIRGAGSLDRLYHHPDLGVVVADLKTGAREPEYPVGVTTQVAIYSRGQRYRDAIFPGSPEFTDGEPNADATAWRKPLHAHLNKTTGLMIHCPLKPIKNLYVCHLYVLDLDSGWENLTLGAKVQKARRAKKLVRL